MTANNQNRTLEDLSEMTGVRISTLVRWANRGVFSLTAEGTVTPEAFRKLEDAREAGDDLVKRAFSKPVSAASESALLARASGLSVERMKELGF